MPLLASLKSRLPSRPASRLALSLALIGTLAGSGAVGAVAAGANVRPPRPNVTIAANQTDGYAQDQVVVFTYGMNYACVHDPLEDLDHDGLPADVDPEEFQSSAYNGPRCVIGKRPKIDPTGGPIQNTEKLFVIVPFFDVNGENQALATTPKVAVQCPEPGPPLSAHKGAFSTCTMHPMKLDLSALDPAFAVAPLVNHSHIIEGKNFGKVWWQIIAVLVTDRSVWPDVDGNCPAQATGGACVTSVQGLRAAQSAGKAAGDIPSNFFLFFDSRELTAHSGH